MSIWTAAFWQAATERAVKTAAQVAVVTIGADLATGFDILAVDWTDVGGYAAGGLVLSYLTSIASGARDGNPSAIKAERVVGRHRDDDGDGTADGA